MGTEHSGRPVALCGILLVVLVAAGSGCGTSAQSPYGQGTGLLKTQPEIAILFFTEALVADPNFRPALRDRGTAWLRTGQYDKAVADFSQFLYLTYRTYHKASQEGNTVDEIVAPVYVQRASAYLALRRFKDTIRDADFAIALDGSSAPVYFYRGSAYTRLADRSGELADISGPGEPGSVGTLSVEDRDCCDKALADFDKAIRIDAKYARAFLERGRVQALTGELKLAIADFAQAYGLDPQDAESHYRRSLALRRQGQIDTADQELRQVQNLDPKLFRRIANNQPPRSRDDLKEVMVQSGSRADSVSPVLPAPPSESELSLQQGIAHLWASDEARAAGEMDTAEGLLDDAVRDLDEALAKNGKNTEAYFRRGVAYARKMLFEKAIEDLKMAVYLNPPSFDARLLLAQLLFDKGSYLPAEDVCRPALRSKPGSVVAWVLLAKACLAQKKFDEAIAAYETASRLAPQLTAELKPQLAESFYRKGEQQANLGDWKLALRSLDQALEYEPDNSQMYFLRAKCHERQGHAEDAVHDYEKYLELGPSQQEVGPLRSSLAELYVKKAQQREKYGDYLSSVEDLVKAANYRPEWKPNLAPQVSLRYTFLGRFFAGNQKHDEAIKLFTLAIAWDGLNASAYRWRGNSRQKQGQQLEANKDFDKAKQLEKLAEPPLLPSDSARIPHRAKGLLAEQF
ncbi:MAG: tetratricopeptide repeat protein [Planctomycetota bacterium]|nr:tetratricopeptide repeat protein [Planctomycetota bacterium]